MDETGDEANRDICLSYDILSIGMQKEISPFGLGWSLNGLSSFTNTRTLKLSNNQQYSFTGIDSETKLFNFCDQKTQDFHASYACDSTEIHVFHKDGVMEVLQDMGQCGFLLSSLTFSNGETFSFEYEFNQSQARLNRITDLNGVIVLQLEFSGTNLNSIATWRGDSYATIYVNVTNHSTYATLDNMSRPCDGTETPEFVHFRYSIVGDYFLLTTVAFPEGASEEISYDPIGHMYMPSSGMQTIPRVITRSVDPGADLPEVVETYRYPDDTEGNWNFLGYPNSYDWDSEKDNIYAWGSASSYSYWVEITTATGTQNETIQRFTYNAFHLLIRESLSKMGCKTETINQYPCDDVEHKDKNFEELPNNLKFPTKTIRTFSKGEESRSFHTIMNTDNSGNLLQVTHPNNTIDTFEYYPSSGHENCPPDPFGLFNRFMKTDLTESSDGTLRKQKVFSYAALKPLLGEPSLLSHVVKVSRIEIGDGDQSSLSVNLQHLEALESLFTHNTISEASLTLTDQNQKEWVTTCEFSTTEINGFVTKSNTMRGHDGTSFSYSEVTLAYPSLLTKRIDRTGVVYEATYDPRGRIITNNCAVGTEFEQNTSYEYYALDTERGTPVAFQIDSSGSKTRIAYTGAGELLEAAMFSTTNPAQFLPVLSYTFDNLGQVQSETRSDYNPDGTVLYSVTVDNKYDGWGQLCESRDSAGVTTLTTNDPFQISRKEEVMIRDAETVISSLATATTKYNLFKQPVSIVVNSSTAGAIETTTQYDGLGRKTTTKSPLGSETSVEEYDFLDRILSVKNPENVSFRIHYAEFSPKRVLERIEISDNEISSDSGRQVHDGIGRVTNKIVNGLETMYSYADGNKFPDTIITPSRNTISLQYNSVLESLPSKIETWRGERNSQEGAENCNTFSYATKSENGTTNLVHASNNHGSYSFSYSSLGKKEGMQQIIGNQNATTTFQASSLLGKPLVSEIIVGADIIIISYTYDEFGRLKKTSQSNLEAEIDYDLFGRICRETIVDDSGSVKQITEQTYDDLSREEHRTIRNFCGETENVYSNECRYDDENRLLTKLVNVNGEQKLCENFVYDKCSRLKKYIVSDGYDARFLPQAGQSNLHFISQQFTFNFSDGITEVITTLESGAVDIATWNYENVDTRHPKSINHSLTSHFPETESFTYDLDGNISNIRSTSGKNVSMQYTVAGRLSQYMESPSAFDKQFSSDASQITEPSAAINKNFTYDPFERVLKEDNSEKYYYGQDIIRENGNPEGNVDFIRSEDRVVAQKSRNVITTVGMDKMRSAVVYQSAEELQYQVYSPFGFATSVSRGVGYNGELQTGDAPVYLLGSGTRAYMPQYGIFSSADSFSPFSGGGINPFMYCRGNPINSCDPSGHISTRADLGLNIFGLVIEGILLVAAVIAIPASGGASTGAVFGILGSIFGIVSSTFGIAADSMSIRDSKIGSDRSRVISKLGVTSSSFGILSAATGAAGGVAAKSKDFSGKGHKCKAKRANRKVMRLRKQQDILPQNAEHAAEHMDLKLRIHKSEARRDKHNAKLPEKELHAAAKLYQRSIAAVIELDFNKVQQVLKQTKAIVDERFLRGMFAAAELTGDAVSATLLIEGTWNIEGSSDDVSAGPLSDMVKEKYPVPC